MAEIEKIENEKKVEMFNGILAILGKEKLEEIFLEVAKNPLPIVLKLDLKNVEKIIFEQSKKIYDLQLELLKKYNATQKDNSLIMEQNNPHIKEYQKEFNELANTKFDLGIKEMIKFPCKFKYLGNDYEVVLPDASFNFLSLFCEFVR